jgi:hypothetical protein
VEKIPAEEPTQKRYSQKIASLGFEPKQTESKSVVLPLHHEAVGIPYSGGGKVMEAGIMTSINFAKM